MGRSVSRARVESHDSQAHIIQPTTDTCINVKQAYCHMERNMGHILYGFLGNNASPVHTHCFYKSFMFEVVRCSLPPFALCAGLKHFYTLYRLKSVKGAYLLLLAAQRGAERLPCGQARRRGGRLSQVVLRGLRAAHGISRFLGVSCGREHHHHFGQGQRPPLLNEPADPRGGGGQRTERQSLALPAAAAAAVRAVGAARAILLHARGGPSLATGPGRIARATAREPSSTNNNNAAAHGRRREGRVPLLHRASSRKAEVGEQRGSAPNSG